MNDDTARTQEGADRARALLRRAVREAAGLGDPGPPAPAEAGAFAALPAAVVRAELDALLLGPHAGRGLDHLRISGALSALLPEVQALVGLHEDTIRQDPRGRDGYAHKDVWAHTGKVVDQSPRTTVLRWAALLHDVGKARTRSVEADGTVHFLGHAEVGARITRRILRRLGMPDEPAEAVRFLVLYHLRASPYEASWTDSAIRRLARDMGERFDDLIALSRADITTQRPEKRRRGLAGLDELVERTRRILAQDARPIPLPKGLGAALIAHFGLPPGPIIGKLRKAIEKAAERGEVPMQAPFEVYLDYARRELGHLIGDVPPAPTPAPRTGNGS